MGDSNRYKKLLLQRSILDTLRVYLDLTDSFLDQLRDSEILTYDEDDTIRRLRWPSNRNELLQIFIKKPWDGDMFTRFCDILRDTQPPKLQETFVKKAEEVIEEEKQETPVEKAKVNDDLEDMDDGHFDLDTHLREIKGMHNRNMIRHLIQEKDSEIAKLRQQNEELNQEIKETLSEYQHCREKHRSLDAAVTDLITGGILDNVYDSLEEGIGEIKHEFEKHIRAVRELEVDKNGLKMKLKEVQEKVNIMTVENTELRRENADLKARVKASSMTNHSQIEELRGVIIAAEKKSNQTEQKIKRLEHVHRGELGSMEIELKQTKDQLRAATRNLDDARRERERLREEAKLAGEKARKFLNYLQIEIKSDNLALMFEHARDISMVRRRRFSTVDTLVEEKSFSREEKVPKSPEPVPFRSTFSPRQRNAFSEHTDNNGSSTSAYVSASLPDSVSTTSLSTNGNTTSLPGRKSSENNNEHTPINGGVKLPGQVNGKVQRRVVRCQRCGKRFNVSTNFDGACISHKPGATKLHKGTPLEVWSCCRSRNTLKGCQMGKHIFNE